MRNFSLFVLLFGMLIFSSCEKETSVCTFTSIDSKTTYDVGPYDPSTIINQASWNGSCLSVNVSYGGGCEEHFFKLVSDGSVIYTLPPIVVLGLIHDNTDLCEAIVTEEVDFDLSSLSVWQESEFFVKFLGNDQLSVKVNH